MMMRVLVLFLGLVPASLCLAQSQNSEMSFLFGWTPQNVETEPDLYRTRYQPVYQIRYSHQFSESDRGRLYWELMLPIAVIDNYPLLADRSRPNAVRSTSHLGGIRYQRHVHPRVALHAGIAGGISMQRRNLARQIEDREFRTSDTRIVPTVGLSAGTSFRLHRRLSLQFSVTNFVAPLSYPQARRNNLIFQPGIGFHF
jgi:hypothetical protein